MFGGQNKTQSQNRNFIGTLTKLMTWSPTGAKRDEVQIYPHAYRFHLRITERVFEPEWIHDTKK